MEKKLHPFDDFLRETLKGHQLTPREEARKAFLEEAAAIRKGRGGWHGWYYLLPLLFIVSGTIALIFYFDKDIPSGGPLPAGLSDTSSPVPEIPAESTSLPAYQAVSEQSQLPSLPEVQLHTRTNNHQQPFYLLSFGYSPYLHAAMLSYREQPILVLPVHNDEEEAETAGNLAGPGADRGKIPLVITISSYYAPEWMFNTIEGGKYVSNFGLDITFYKGLTSIRTGLGISISKGITENSVAYNEYLGTFNKLDSISFTFDENSYAFYPEIYTSSETVWDSAVLQDSNEIVKRYSYLQVPLVLGFDFWQQGSFTLGVRVGTVMSLMLNSKQLTGAYEAGENLVVGSQKVSPDQLNLNWQAVGGINARINMSEKMFFEIEPQLKYYYSSIYEKSGFTKKPWSAGARFALGFRF
jgi:hypothetical protein